MKTALKYLMALLYIAAGVNHFINPGFYTNIMPPYIPWHGFWVAASGVAEILLGVLLLIPATSALAAWGIVAMLVVFFVVHVHMLLNPQMFPGVPYTGLVARLLFQFVLIAWAWWYTRPAKSSASA